MIEDKIILTEEILESIKLMLKSTNDDEENLAIQILSNRDQNDKSSESYFNDLEIWLDRIEHNRLWNDGKAMMRSPELNKRIFQRSLINNIHNYNED